MLCDYSYRTNDNKIIDVYQVDTEDFKKFFKKILKDDFVQSIVVKIKHSDFNQWYIWQRPIYSKKIKKFVGGWENLGIKKK